MKWVKSIGSILVLLTAFTLGAKELVPFVYPTDCVGCTDCVKQCPVDDQKALFMRNGKAVIDPVNCTSCGICVNVCGFNAVRWK